MDPPSLLTNRAEPRAASALYDAADRAAVLVVAGLAFAAIDVEAGGEIAQLAVWLGEKETAGVEEVTVKHNRNRCQL